MRALHNYGYYMFLGVGDFGYPESLTNQWTSAWTITEWRARIQRLKALGTNTLLIYLMGNRLPFPSQKYGACLESEHPNVKNEFFQEVLDACRGMGIKVIATFTTTGHAQSFVQQHPEDAIRSKEGEACVESAIACHHRESARQYAGDNILDCLTRYHGFSGVILHPPEFSTPCYCDICRQKYRDETGRSLTDAPIEDARRFFMRTNLHFQRYVLEPLIQETTPNILNLTFTIPWIFETHFESMAREIPPSTIIVDWDYALTPDKIQAIPARLRRYRAFGHRLWFMPTSGFAFNKERSAETQAEAVKEQIRLCLENQVQDIIYYMGPIWWDHVETTSWTGGRSILF